VSLAPPMVSNATSLFHADIALDAHVDMRREEKQYAREKKPSQELFVLLKRIDCKKNHACREQPGAHDVQRDEQSPLKNTNTCGLKFDNAEHPHDEKNSGESDHDISQHLDFLSGART
jgi:hypothetical protein